MSRTNRSKPYSCLRNPKTFSTIKTEGSSLEELMEHEEPISNRHRHRGNPSGSIPTGYDDLPFASCRQFKY